MTEINETNISTKYKCIHCEHEIKPNARYCSKCGKIQIAETGKNDNIEIRKFFIIISIIGIYILSQYLFIQYKVFICGFYMDAAFILIVLLLLVYFRKEIKNIIGLTFFRWKKLLKYIGMQLIFSGIVYLLMLGIRKLAGIQAFNLIEPYQGFKWPLLIATISVAIFPAITEELAFRGILFNQLLKLSSGTSTIIVTGILFGLLHFSFLSYVWLIPAGFFLGWIRHRENTICYGVFCHFLHNFIMVIIDYYRF